MCIIGLLPLYGLVAHCARVETSWPTCMRVIHGFTATPATLHVRNKLLWASTIIPIQEIALSSVTSQTLCATDHRGDQNIRRD